MIDQNLDTSYSVLREIIAERPSLAPRVKTAEVGLAVRDSLPLTAFADPARRMFPVHTPEQALLSRAYLEKVASPDLNVLSRVNQALQVYELGLPGIEFRKVAAWEEETAPTYMLPQQKLFPLYPTTDLQKAASALQRTHKKLATSSLATAATTLVKEAAARDIDLPIDIYQWAGIVPCDREKAADWIDARASATKSPVASSAYTRVASLVRHLPFNTERAELTKVAEAVAALDERFELTHHYGKALPDPLRTIFNTKTAMGEMVQLGEVPVPLSALVKMGPDFFSDILGPEIVGEISHDGVIDPSAIKEILPTLPRDMQTILIKQLGASGECGSCC